MVAPTIQPGSLGVWGRVTIGVMGEGGVDDDDRKRTRRRRKFRKRRYRR